MVPLQTFGLLVWAACGGDEALIVLPDTGFRADAALTSDTGGTDDTDLGTGCSLLNSEADCAATERCTPSLTGGNLCVPAGGLDVGSPCGDDGVDRCQRGQICLATDTRAASCQTLCDPTAIAPCPDSEPCIGPQWLLAAGAGVCTP